MNDRTSDERVTWLISFGLGAIGLSLMVEGGVSWKALAGLALILWGNNLSQVRR